jgi:hypothetical protein
MIDSLCVCLRHKCFLGASIASSVLFLASKYYEKKTHFIEKILEVIA